MISRVYPRELLSSKESLLIENHFREVPPNGPAPGILNSKLLKRLLTLLYKNILGKYWMKQDKPVGPNSWCILL
jgi:hypothetical protein